MTGVQTCALPISNSTERNNLSILLLVGRSDQMNSAAIQRPPIGLSSLRSSITWLIITMLTIYVLYSSKLIFNKRQLECPLPSSDISTRQNVEDSSPFANESTISNYSAQEPAGSATAPPPPPPSLPLRDDTELKHIAFGIAASSNLWDKRKEYIKLWWRPGETRGAVCLRKASRHAKHS